MGRWCPWLYVLTASREPWKEDLEGYKVVPVCLGGLDAASAAQLLQRRSRRRFTEADVQSDSRSNQSSSRYLRSDESVELLSNHPVVIRANGSPGQIAKLAQRVTPELRSLYDLL